MRRLILKGFSVIALVGSSAIAQPDESNPKLQKLRREQAEAAERVKAAQAAKAAAPAVDTSKAQAAAAEANANFEKTRATLDAAERKLNAVKRTEQIANDNIASSLKKLDAAKSKLAKAEQQGSSEGTLRNLRREVSQAEQSHTKVEAHAKNMLAEATPERRQALEAEVENARKNNNAARESAVSAARQVPADVKAAQGLEQRRAEVAAQDRQNLAEGKKPAAEQKQIDDRKKFDRRLQANSLLFEGKKSAIAGATDVNKEAETVQKNQRRAVAAKPEFLEAQKANREQKALRAEMQKNFDQSGAEMADADRRFQERKAKSLEGRLDAVKAKVGGLLPGGKGAGDGAGVEQMSKGADKRVLTKPGDASNVYYVAQPGKEAALKKEFEKARTILNESRAAAAANGERPPKHLALDWEEVPESERINGKFTLRTAKAELGNLESVISSKTLSPAQRLDVAHQVTEAVKDLHRAGFVHGDLKPDNFLVGIEKGADGKPVLDAEGKPKLLVTLSDVGKATRVESGGDGAAKKGIAGKVQEVAERFNRGKGNTRFRAPEGPGRGQQVFAAETASALKIVRRVVEEGVLDSKGTPLVDAGDAKKKAGTKDARRGFELFAVESSDFIARDERGKVSTAKLKSGVKRVGEALVARSPQAIKREVDATREYDQVLVDRLKTANPELADQYDRLGKILNAGLEPPEKRPSLNEVADGLGDVAKKAGTAKADALSRVNDLANRKAPLTRGEMRELIRFADPASPDGELKEAAKKGLAGNHLNQLVSEGKAADQKKPSAQELVARQVLSSLAAESNPDAESRKAAQQVLRTASGASTGQVEVRERIAQNQKTLSNQRDVEAAAEREARKAPAVANDGELSEADAKRNRLAKERASLENATKRMTQNASEAADSTNERRAAAARQQRTAQQNAEAQSSRMNTLAKPTGAGGEAAAVNTRPRSSSAPPKIASVTGTKPVQAPAMKPTALKPAIAAPDAQASTQLRPRATGSTASPIAMDSGSKRAPIRMKPLTAASLQADIKAAEAKAARAKQQSAVQTKTATTGTKKAVSTQLSDSSATLKSDGKTMKSAAATRQQSAAKTLKSFGTGGADAAARRPTTLKPKPPPRT